MFVILPYVQRRIAQFVRTHRKSLNQIEFVIGISRGGLIPAALIATALDKPLVCAYIDRQDRVFLDRVDWIKGKHVLLVDDIIRTGSTFNKIIARVKRHHPLSIKSFTLFTLKNASTIPTWTHISLRDRRLPWDKRRT